ncbi:hypothetical protein P3T76_013593 [Phytophthora citrophthora]|uniref:PWWP domain-containing protein n=1 Tax=Phytophthora citrophthora TaxID=4793 RepID=A0AAD9G2Q2_9STRA|nr:hypothetical protein P3T76_013593 [Phytophthora citrophthora]
MRRFAPAQVCSVKADQKEQPKVMKPVRKGSLSMSLTMPLPLRKKKKVAEVPVKKIHVPYFFPLLEETAEWWQTQDSTVSVAQEQEPEADPASRHGLGSLSSSNQNKAKITASQNLMQDRLQLNATDTLTAVPIEVGGKPGSLPAAMAKQKRSPRRRLPCPSVTLAKGDWLVDTSFSSSDVMDQEGVWNVARVLSVPSPEEVEIMYDGWPEEYDEVVRVDSDRVAPLHTFTWAAKCWVKYLNWPMWPSLITIRTPGTEEGIKNLATENRLYVDFLDSPDFEKRDRCWQMKRQVVAFDENYDKNRVMTNGAEFEQALVYVLRSNASIKMPAFAKGTLPLQYKSATTESVKAKREATGREKWYQNFATNSRRHMQTHVYGDDAAEDPASDESKQLQKVEKRRPKLSTRKTEKHRTSPTKKRLTIKKQQSQAVKIEQDLLTEVEVPYELEVSDSSDDHDDRSESGAVEVVSQTMTAAKRPDKAVARRSVPPATKYLILTASPKRRVGHSSSLPPGIDLEDEEKGVLEDVGEEPGLQELETKFSTSGHIAKRTGREEMDIDDTASSKTSRRSKPSKSVISLDQQIEKVKKTLRGLHAQKKKELIKDEAVKERRKRVKPSTPSSQDIHSPRRLKMSRVRHSDASGLLLLSRSDPRRQGRFIETPVDVSLPSTSFLAVEEDPDGQEVTEELAIDVQSEPKESTQPRKEEAKLVTEQENVVKAGHLHEDGQESVVQANQLNKDEDRVEEKSEEIRRPFCMMQSGAKGSFQVVYLCQHQVSDVVVLANTEVADAEKVKTRISKKTVIGVPRKFAKEMPCVSVNPVDSMLRIAPPPPLSAPNAGRSRVALTIPSTGIFDSSEGFSMGSWFKRTLIAKYRRTET